MPKEEKVQAHEQETGVEQNNVSTVLRRSLNNICYEYLFQPYSQAVRDKYNLYQNRVDYALTIYELVPTPFLVARNQVLQVFMVHYLRELSNQKWNHLQPESSCAVVEEEFRKICQMVTSQMLYDEYKDSLSDQLLNQDWQPVGNIYNHMTTFALQNYLK